MTVLPAPDPIAHLHRAARSRAAAADPSASRSGSCPYRWPARSLSPGRTRHTMRRASTPEICRTVSGRRVRLQRDRAALVLLRRLGLVGGQEAPGHVFHGAPSPAVDRGAIHVDVEGREEDRDAHRPAHPAILDLRDAHHPAVGGRQHGARHRRAPSARDPGKNARNASATAAKAPPRRRAIPSAPGYTRPPPAGKMNGHPSAAIGIRTVTAPLRWPLLPRGLDPGHHACAAACRPLRSGARRRGGAWP